LCHPQTHILISRTQVTTIYDIPPLQVSNFVMRKSLLKRLRKEFEQYSTTSPRLIVVLLGMGGAGKTQLALEYCRSVKVSRTHRAVFWVDASSQNALYRAFETIVRRLFPERVINDPQVAVALVKDALSSWSDRWLMVFDNLDNPADFQGILNFFPDSRLGSILITSRYVGSRELGRSIDLDRMEKNEGLQLLLSSLQPDREELLAAEQILTQLGYLPLAIDQARAYISRRQLRLRAFINEYEKRKNSLMKETPTVWQYGRMFPSVEEHTPLSLFTTWEMSLQLLGTQAGHQEGLQEVLTLFSFFNPISVSEKLFSSDNEDGNLTTSPASIFFDDDQWNHNKFEDAVVQMRELSLLQSSHRDGNEIVVSLHSMVSEWLRMRLDKDRRSALLAVAVSHLEIDLNRDVHRDHSSRQEALSHIDTIWQMIDSSTGTGHFFQASHTFGYFSFRHSRLEDAERMYGRALAGKRKAWGPEHTSTLETINSMGILYRNQGRLEDAERMYNRALAGFEKAWGPEHTSTLETVNSMGILYTDQGRLEDAERMYNRALAGFEKALGPKHTSTLQTVNNMGILYVDQGRLEDAERMHNRALAGYEKAWGPEHTPTLDTVNNMGLLYAKQGRLKDAERMYNRALAGFEKALGPEHTSTLDTVNNMGALYANQGRLEDAERMYNRALAGKEKAWGPKHTSTLNTINNMGMLYADQGRLEDAERMYNCALAGKEKAWGPEHTSTLQTVNNMGNLYADQGRLEDAERMYSRALAGYEKALGPEHTSTLRTVNNMGILYKKQGRRKDAKRMFNRATSGKEKASGP
jgi:tetratricopeptide (TPR) repeat protein